MAQIIRNFLPEDLKTTNQIGFSLPLNGNAVFKPTYQTKDQVKFNLINFLLTNKGERIFNPTFGADLNSLLFENINEDLLEDIEFNVRDKISNNFPQIDIILLKINSSPNTNQVNIVLKYSISNLKIIDDINILLNQG